MVVLGFYAQGEAKILTIELGQTAFGETAFWGLLGLLGSVVSHSSDILIFLVSYQTNYCGGVAWQMLYLCSHAAQRNN